MVRGHRRGRRRGARGGGTTPPVASTPEGSNPQGDEQVLGQEKIAVGDVVRMCWRSEVTPGLLAGAEPEAHQN
jgi:hypothetical protein